MRHLGDDPRAAEADRDDRERVRRRPASPLPPRRHRRRTVRPARPRHRRRRGRSDAGQLGHGRRQRSGPRHHAPAAGHRDGQPDRLGGAAGRPLRPQHRALARPRDRADRRQQHRAAQPPHRGRLPPRPRPPADARLHAQPRRHRHHRGERPQDAAVGAGRAHPDPPGAPHPAGRRLRRGPGLRRGAAARARPVRERGRDHAALRPRLHPLDQADDAYRSAYGRLGEELARVSVAVSLAPGEVLVVDNDLVVHGRVPFQARYDGTDRWLKRASVRVPGRRTRPLTEAHEHGYGQSAIEAHAR
nr:TauD/TfdA family dioxygenase [Streptomyces avermitilis]